MTLHRNPDADPVAVMREIHDQIAVTPMPAENRLHHELFAPVRRWLRGRLLQLSMG